ncbi:hypothetical protein AA101099_1573 [Neoasaia chiangmaiensis NBRC 101099]|uniref:hypothetical protein n=1 Tax=Neoasaia chiangmaiensis TaxID=320497 RepID=UPI00118F08C4|nr:hypothetical protein [Neoasaia chiangmaiensis]GBR39233.1 hypothetical protein AA101099_1573 [Neoasaia chiangmaiensis NBRC 101099]GEN15509.1 hypothetical protein NCH01_19400 [Neoasaia chiangmaiensis]
MSLYEAFKNVSIGEIEKNAQYFSIYERYLHKYKNNPCRLFLIIDGDHSLAQAEMWRKYLGGFSIIVCITESDYNGNQIFCREGNIDDKHFRENLFLEFGCPDIVIDDGSHMPNDTIKNFEIFSKTLSHNGLYFVEDVYTSYWRNYEGGLLRENTFIEYTKSLIDELHACHTGQDIPPNAFSEKFCGIHIYDGLIVFESGKYFDRRSIKNIS